MNNNTNDPAMEKFLADLDAVDFDDFDDDGFHGNTINAEKWQKYRQIVKAMVALRGKDNKSILKIHYLTEPDPAEEFVSAMAVFPQAVALGADTKNVFTLATLLSDSIAMTTAGNKIRISFVVSDIWTN